MIRLLKNTIRRWFGQPSRGKGGKPGQTHVLTGSETEAKEASVPPENRTPDNAQAALTAGLAQELEADEKKPNRRQIDGGDSPNADGQEIAPKGAADSITVNPGPPATPAPFSTGSQANISQQPNTHQQPRSAKVHRRRRPRRRWTRSRWVARIRQTTKRKYGSMPRPCWEPFEMNGLLFHLVRDGLTWLYSSTRSVFRKILSLGQIIFGGRSAKHRPWFGRIQAKGEKPPLEYQTEAEPESNPKRAPKPGPNTEPPASTTPGPIHAKSLDEKGRAELEKLSEQALQEAQSGLGQIKPFRVKGSLVVSISLLYLTLTVVNLFAFWIATGSNQMRLISANALLKAQTGSFEIMRRIEPLTNEAGTKAWKVNPQKNIAFLVDSFAEMKQAGLAVEEWLVVRSDNKVMHNSGKTALQRLEPAGFQKLVRSIQLRELKGQPYYGVPDILSYNVAVYMPLTQFGSGEIVLSFTLPMESIEAELGALFQLALVMLAVMLGIQTLFGLFIYLRFLRPVRTLAEGAQAIASGRLDIQLDNRRSDELGFLTHWFNQMTGALKRMTDRLKENIAELAARKEELESHMAMAAEIQNEIIPKKAGGAFINAAVHFEPLEAVSGDYYDFVRLADGSQGVLIADAMGHGVPAAFMTMMAKVHFQDAVANAYDPGHVLNLMSQNFQRLNISGESYLTGIFFVIDSDLKMRLARAGHQPALILRAGSNEVEHVKPRGFFIGLDPEGIEFEIYKSQMAPGDRILLFTDGLVEAENRDKVQYGLEPVKNMFVKTRHLSPEDQLTILVGAVHNHLDGLLNTDDLTVMIVEIGQKDSGSIEELARLEFRSRNFETALEYFREWYGKKRRKPAEVRMGIALSLIRLRRYEEALLMLEELENVEYVDYELYINKGLALAKMGQLESALESYARAAQLNPVLGLPDRSRAAILFRLGRAAEAWRLLDELADRMSGNTEEYFRTMAYIHKMDGRHPRTNRDES